MGNFSVVKKSANQVEYQGKTYTCDGERIVIDGQVRWLYRTRNGLDCDILVCDDRYLEEPEFTHLTKLPGGCYMTPVEEPSEDRYLTFTAQEGNASIGIRWGVANSYYPASDPEDFDVNIEYSLDDGVTWENYTVSSSNTEYIELSEGETVKFRGNNETLVHDNTNIRFSIDGVKVSASGDVTSLMNGEGGDVSLEGQDYCFGHMFYNCTSLTQAPTLPSSTLAEYCYNYMFNGCTSLTTSPELPATELADYCYSYMFCSCTGLTESPELPAAALANGCYSGMLTGCTGLTTAPELPATTLVDSCYYYMFNDCTGLTTAPELPATTLVDSCYGGMFSGCTSLNHVKAMFLTTPGSTYTVNWLSEVSATGTFVKNSQATWNVTGSSGIPSGWQVETAAE